MGDHPRGHSKSGRLSIGSLTGDPRPPAAYPAETIAAIATPPGRGGIGIVRISGAALRNLYVSLTGIEPTPRRAAFAQFRDADGGILDEGLALYFPAPYSYTGEDVIELQGHGGPVVLHAIVQRSIALGVRLAAPGEFTQRAFLNGKLDLAQAEAVIDLIDASSLAAARSALRSLRGEFSREVDGLAAALNEVRAWMEAAIDFPDEAIDTLVPEALRVRIVAVGARLAQITGRARRGSQLRAGIHVVIAGAPNVGKSSLINQLAGDDIAIVTAQAGTTRDVIRQTIHLEGLPFHLSDTAGLRETAEEVEQLGVARARQEIEQADLLLEVRDARDPDASSVRVTTVTTQRLIVLNKVDLVGPGSDPSRLAPGLAISAKTGQGMEGLRRALLAAAGWEGSSEDVILARARHLDALRRAATHVQAAADIVAEPECAAEELRLAQQALEELTGRKTADDLLGEIFGRFCLGK